MAEKVYRIHAGWDPEAGVWVAESDDVPGLATEAETIEKLAERLRILIPELLEANHVIAPGASKEISFELTSQRQERVRLAS